MKCYYEVLDVSKDADDAEIKTAYRKLALKWHPDKNLDNTDYAKEQFQIVQQAYEVLSDKQERAWYDKHREDILRGCNSEYQDNSLDVYQYFTTSCFDGYEDDEKGFYFVYRNVFEKIAKEDMEFMDDVSEFTEIPSFGTSTSDYDSVVKPFYIYWMNYSTKKSYSWLDPCDIRDGKGNRRVLKMLEKENKKVRQKARQERNEEVRNLVAFVKKRDKRVQANKKQMEAKTLENKKKQDVLMRQKRMERKKLHENENQAEWTKFDNVQSELEEIEKHLDREFGDNDMKSDEEVDDTINNLYCIACNKVFKNPKAFENHEFSKKHKQNVEILKHVMTEENLNFTDVIDEEKEILDCDDQEAILDTDSNTSQLSFSETTKREKKNKLKQTNNDKIAFIRDAKEQSEECLENESTEHKSEEILKGAVFDSDSNLSQLSLNETTKRKKKKNKLKQTNTDKRSFTRVAKEQSDYFESESNENESEEIPNIAKLSDNDDFEFNSNKKPKRSKTNNTNKLKENIPDDLARMEQFERNKTSKRNLKKLSKKEIAPTDLTDIDVHHCCVTCENSFPSKNKLFDHLRNTGHGVYLPSKSKKKHKKVAVQN